MDAAEQTPRNEYGRYHLPEGLEHRPAVQAVLNGEVFEPDTVAFMRRHAGDGDVIHAGAFFGDFIPGLSKALAPGRRLWAFEPNPGNFAAAEKTVALNGLNNVTLINAALSDREGEILFRTHTSKGVPLGGASKHVLKDGPGVTRVPSVMIDYAVPLDRKVSIVQLDVEGHERKALKGAHHIINRWAPILILEYFNKGEWIARNFREPNYRPIGKLHDNYVYAAGPVEI